VPAAYYMEKADRNCSGIILMEDVSGLGKSIDVFKSVTLGQCLDVARIIANLQAQLHFKKDQSWRQCFSLNVKTTNTVDAVVNGIMHPALELENKDILDYVTDYVDMDLKALSKFAMEEFSGQYDANTLCHSDMWSNNMLMKFNADGSTTDEIASIIDWQIACLGNPLYDITSFILLCASGDMRRECEQKLVDYYYTELCRLYASHDSEPNFTREQAHEFYNVAFAQLVVSLIMTFAVHAMPLSNSTDPEEQAKFKTMVHRLRAACQDAQPTLKKYNLVERFTPKN